MFSLICAWMNGWINNREASDLRCHLAHYDVTVMHVTVNRCFIVPKDCLQSSWHYTMPSRYLAVGWPTIASQLLMRPLSAMKTIILPSKWTLSLHGAIFLENIRRKTGMNVRYVFDIFRVFSLRLFILLSIVSIVLLIRLTLWCLSKMRVILQTAFPNTFVSKHIKICRFEWYHSLFLRVL